MEPVLAVWDGLYLNKAILSEAELQPYVDAALNELEFCMGNTSTTYGALRASLGYPEPFLIKYVEIGNEDDLSSYEISTYEAYRFAMFYDAISAAYPDIKVMASFAGYWYADNYGDYHEYSVRRNLVLLRCGTLNIPSSQMSSPRSSDSLTTITHRVRTR